MPSRLPPRGRRRVRPTAIKGNHDAGLTLIECLAAIIVVGFIGAAIAPVLVISVATRIQSQKSEQALALAQGEIDFVRAQLERGGANIADLLPPEATDLNAADPLTAASAPNAQAPEATKADRYPANYQQLRLVDIDNDGEDDFGIQVYRDTTANTGEAVAFSVGVRVYDMKSVESNLADLDIQQASIGLASGQGDRVRQPLATLYTTVASSEDTQSLCNLVDYLGDVTDVKPLGCVGVEEEEEEEEEEEDLTSP